MEDNSSSKGIKEKENKAKEKEKSLQHVVHHHGRVPNFTAMFNNEQVLNSPTPSKPQQFSYSLYSHLTSPIMASPSTASPSSSHLASSSLSHFLNSSSLSLSTLSSSSSCSIAAPISLLSSTSSASVASSSSFTTTSSSHPSEPIEPIQYVSWTDHFPYSMAAIKDPSQVLQGPSLISYSSHSSLSSISSSSSSFSSHSMTTSSLTTSAAAAPTSSKPSKLPRLLLSRSPSSSALPSPSDSLSPHSPHSPHSPQSPHSPHSINPFTSIIDIASKALSKTKSSLFGSKSPATSSLDPHHHHSQHQQQQHLLKQQQQQQQLQQQQVLSKPNVPRPLSNPSSTANSSSTSSHVRKNANTPSKLGATEHNPINLLLFGTGDSGKSTFFKQFNFAFSKRTSEPYSHDFLVSNIFLSLHRLLFGLNPLHLDLENPRLEREKVEILKREAYSEVNVEKLMAKRGLFKQFWRNRAVREAFYRGSRFHLSASTEYWMDNAERIIDKDYQVNENDLLRTYVKTTGLSIAKFEANGLHWKLSDTGGQRSERPKWVHVLNTVHVVFFIVSLSEFDQMLVEDNQQNRLQESLVLFESLCNCRWLKNVPIVIFFNKVDLFVDKFGKVPFQKYFPRYSGGDDPKKALEFIMREFTRLDHREGPKKLFTHVTCAIDSAGTRTLISNLCANIGVCLNTEVDTKIFDDSSPAERDWSELESLNAL